MRAGSTGMGSKIERHHAPGDVLHRKLEQSPTQPEPPVLLRDHDILYVVAKTWEVSVRNHHRESDDPAAVPSDVDQRLRCDQLGKALVRQGIPGGLQLRYQHVDVGDRGTVDCQEVLDPVFVETTHEARR